MVFIKILSIKSKIIFQKNINLSILQLSSIVLLFELSIYFHLLTSFFRNLPIVLIFLFYFFYLFMTNLSQQVLSPSIVYSHEAPLLLAFCPIWTGMEHFFCQPEGTLIGYTSKAYASGEWLKCFGFTCCNSFY